MSNFFGGFDPTLFLSILKKLFKRSLAQQNLMTMMTTTSEVMELRPLTTMLPQNILAMTSASTCVRIAFRQAFGGSSQLLFLKCEPILYLKLPIYFVNKINKSENLKLGMQLFIKNTYFRKSNTKIFAIIFKKWNSLQFKQKTCNCFTCTSLASKAGDVAPFGRGHY